MARLAPKLDVIRTLFGLSRNQCAFPKCEQALFNHRNQFIAQICHIEAALPGGERFNPESTDEDRRDFNNLIILCYPHHIETNDEKKFTVEVLREIKTSHESQNSEARLAINDEKLIEINNYIKRNWLQIDYANKHQHLYREYGFAVDINIDLDFTELSKILEDLICQLDISSSELRQSLTSDVSFQSSKNGQIEFGRLQSIHFWETVCLFLPNSLQYLRLYLYQIEVKYYENLLLSKQNENCPNTFQKLEFAKQKLLNYATEVTFCD